MSDANDRITLDNKSIMELLSELSQEERIIFSELMQESRETGANASSVVIGELAKKYADRARLLVGRREQ